MVTIPFTGLSLVHVPVPVPVPVRTPCRRFASHTNFERRTVPVRTLTLLPTPQTTFSRLKQLFHQERKSVNLRCHLDITVHLGHIITFQHVQATVVQGSHLILKMDDVELQKRRAEGVRRSCQKRLLQIVVRRAVIKPGAYTIVRKAHISNPHNTTNPLDWDGPVAISAQASTEGAVLLARPYHARWVAV